MVGIEVTKVVSKFRKAVRATGIRVDKMVLFGSHANGTPHEWSDIDVAVVSPDFGKNRHREGLKLLNIAIGTDPRIEPIPVSSESYQHDTWVPLIFEIRTNGVEL